MKPIYLSVVIPVYNEEPNIDPLAARLFPVLDGLGRTYEVIFVDDGSRDGSAAQLRRLFTARPEVVRVILFAANFGQHPAILAAFERARGDVVVTLDADLQNAPEDIPVLLEAFDAGHDYVGSIRLGRDDPLFRRVASRVLNRVRERTTRIRMTDQGCMLRAYGRPVVDAINQCSEASTFVPALGYIFAANPTEVEVSHAARTGGTSKYSLYSLVRLNFDLMTGFSLVPLQFFSLLGMFIAVLSMIVYVIVIVQRWMTSSSLLEGLLALWDRDVLQFFLLGIALFGLGLLGEYVGRIYQLVRGRPRYLIGAILERPQELGPVDEPATRQREWAAVRNKTRHA